MGPASQWISTTVHQLSFEKFKGDELTRQDDKKPLGFVFIPHVKEVSEKFNQISNKYNFTTIFKIKHFKEFADENETTMETPSNSKLHLQNFL
jgi:hypothetical protein